jgi:hypothetical protein
MSYTAIAKHILVQKWCWMTAFIFAAPKPLKGAFKVMGKVKRRLSAIGTPFRGQGADIKKVSICNPHNYRD